MLPSYDAQATRAGACEAIFLQTIFPRTSPVQSPVQKPKNSMGLATSEQRNQRSEPGYGSIPFLPLTTMQDLLLDKVSPAPGKQAPGGNGSGASDI